MLVLCGICRDKFDSNIVKAHRIFCQQERVKRIALKNLKKKESQPNIIKGFKTPKGSKSLKREMKRLNKVIKMKDDIINNLYHNKVAQMSKPKHWVYDDPRWKPLRYKTLRKYNFQCLSCNRGNLELHVDHIKPISKYPELAFDENNLQVLCKDCNLGKSNIFEDDLRTKSL